MKAYKGFNKDMTCRGFQYEDGKEYETDKASLCNEGFHACENPIDCFSYYSPSESVYHEVEIEDNGERGNDTKVVGKRIKIGAKISIAGIIKATFEYVKSHSTNDKQGGDCSALQGGDCSALKGGDCSVVYGGKDAKVKGGLYSVIALQYWVDNKLKCIKFKEVDGKEIKADTFYMLQNGEFTECEED